MVLALLAACGDSGGVSSTPAPTPTPTPSPTPSPTPTPSSFDTSEYRRSNGTASDNAIPAWTLGASGKGVVIGIIDSGIDTSNSEFAGRIAPGSADVAGGGRALTNADSDHGTLVALVAAAARNNSGVVGVAYEADILMMRADSPGSCTSADGCAFFGSAIASGIDRAVQSGAKVINISLGGSPPSASVRGAIGRASSAGVVVVVSAGNDADSPTASQDPTLPDPFAVGIRQAGNGNVIIAGSVNSSNVISDFANRAGSEASWYLSALGERICCVYDGSVPKITVQNGQNFVTVVSGTSFSAPQIAGAIALLRQAFPNLTAVQAVDLLLSSAKDLGTAGVDVTYGRGLLDIGKAFAPQGMLSLASTLVPLPSGDTIGVTSTAMGDAGRLAPLSAVMLDSYQRAYRVDLGGRIQSAPLDSRLGAALLAPMDSVASGNDQLSLGFSLARTGPLASSPWQGMLRLSRSDAEVARVLAGRVAARIASHTRVAFGFAQGADGLIAQVQGHSEPAFLIARSPGGDFGFARSGETALALRQRLGKWGLTMSAESAHSASTSGQQAGTALYQRHYRDGMTRFTIAADRNFGALETGLAASWLAEDRTVLGARLNDSFGVAGADSLFLDATAAWPFAPHWRLGAAWRQGYTYARPGGLIAPGSRLTSNAWSFDVARQSVFVRGDSLALRIAQPLRVQSGGINFDLPLAYSYDTLSATNGISTINLSPSGREVDGELSWRGSLWGGGASASLFYRHNPGHFVRLPDDRGLALSWKTGF